MESRRTINTKRNIWYGLLQVAASYLFPFIVRTILIYQLGVDYLGLNSLFASIISVLSLMEMGFGMGVIYSLYKPVAEKDEKLICAYLAYYRKIYRWIGLTILIIGAAIIPFLNYLIKDSSLPGGLNLYACYLIFLVDTVISYLLFGYMTAIPIAYQRRDLLSRVEMGFALVKCAVQSMILLCTGSFYLFLFSMPVITVLRNVVIARTVRNKYPALTCGGEISKEQKKDLRIRVYGLVVNRLTNTSRNSIDSLCISAFLGLALTGLYNNYYYIMAAVLSFGIMVCNSMQASIGNSIAVEDKIKNYHDMRVIDFAFMGIVGWACGCLLCLYQPFMMLWGGEEMVLDNTIAAGFSLYFYILESGAVQWMYHQGAGLWYENRFIMMGETVANIVLNVVLCRWWGLKGIILATSISVFFTNCVFCPRLLFDQYFQNGKVQEYWTDHGLYGLTAFVSAGVSWLLCEWVLPIRNAGIIWNVVSLGGRAVICTGVAATVFWGIWHKSERYSVTKRWIKNILKAK